MHSIKKPMNLQSTTGHPGLLLRGCWQDFTSAGTQHRVSPQGVPLHSSGASLFQQHRGRQDPGFLWRQVTAGAKPGCALPPGLAHHQCCGHCTTAAQGTKQQSQDLFQQAFMGIRHIAGHQIHGVGLEEHSTLSKDATRRPQARGKLHRHIRQLSCLGLSTKPRRTGMEAHMLLLWQWRGIQGFQDLYQAHWAILGQSLQPRPHQIH